VFIGSKDLNEQALNKSNQKQQKTNELVGLNFKETINQNTRYVSTIKKKTKSETIRESNTTIENKCLPLSL